MKKYPIKTEYFNSYDCDFDGRAFAERRIGANYPYKRSNAGYKLLSFFIYRIIMTPIAIAHTYLFSRTKIIGRKKLKAAKGKGYFLYGNHTSPIGDAFTPGAIVFPRRAYTVISSKNMDMPMLGRHLHLMGGIPLPTEPSGAIGFTSAIKDKISSGYAVAIYPEAHLWPFMKELRPFGTDVLALQDRMNAPAFTVTRVYKKSKRRYRCEVYVDGPFLPDRDLSPREARDKLYAEIRAAMEARCGLSDIEVIRYEKREQSNG